MTRLTKDNVRELTPEQQEAIAAGELQRFRSRQHLLERARRGMSVWGGLWTGLASGFAILCVPVPRLVPIALTAVVGLVTFHVFRLHKRLDAMMELHDAEIKQAAEKEQSDGDHA